MATSPRCGALGGPGGTACCMLTPRRRLNPGRRTGRTARMRGGVPRTSATSSSTRTPPSRSLSAASRRAPRRTTRSSVGSCVRGGWCP
eukprot:1013492-Pyramimonas_sp.AAC.1